MKRDNRMKQVIGEPLIINGKQLSLSRAVRAGDFIFLTGQLPFKDGKPMVDADIRAQTHQVIQEIQATLALAGAGLEHIVKSMVWLTDKADFAGFNEVYGDYFPDAPPARSAVVSDLLLDVKVELEVIAYFPEGKEI